jgi:hypothetical protein
MWLPLLVLFGRTSSFCFEAEGQTRRFAASLLRPLWNWNMWLGKQIPSLDTNRVMSRLKHGFWCLHRTKYYSAAMDSESLRHMIWHGRLTPSKASTCSRAQADSFCPEWDWLGAIGERMRTRWRAHCTGNMSSCLCRLKKYTLLSYNPSAWPETSLKLVDLGADK